VPAPAPPEGMPVPAPVPVPVPVPVPPEGIPVPAQEKDNINEENPIQQGGEEEKPCIEIAKYYVKIAHLYGAIMKTINPVIISKDKNGNKHKYDLSSKQSVPTDEEVKSIEHNNFCSRRLNSLIQESDYNRNDPNNLLINLKPRFCKINYDKNTNQSRKFYISKNNDTKYGGDDYDDDDDYEVDRRDGRDRRDRDGVRGNKYNDRMNDNDIMNDNGRMNDNGKDDTKNVEGIMNKNNKDDNDKKITHDKDDDKIKEPIEDKKSDTDDNSYEIGIPELVKLYYDSDYDKNTGEFTKMSNSMINSYQQDLEIFYKSFTGKNIPIDENGNKKINQFSQIPLREFHTNEKCKENGILSQNYEVSQKHG
jgi:hypothetical protein